MNIFIFSAVLCQIFVIKACSASVPIAPRQIIDAVYVLTGNNPTGTPYPNYTVTVPENGVTIQITNPLIVYSISPIADLTALNPNPPGYGQANCTFTLQDGTKAYVDSTYDIIPQKVVSVSCVAAVYPGITTFSSLSSSPSTLSSTFSVNSSPPVSGRVPPYPTGTRSFYVTGTTGAPVSAAATATGVTRDGTSVVPFTGGAGRADRSFGGFLAALLGIVAAL